MSEAKIILSAADRTAAAFASATKNLRSLGEQALSIDSVLAGLGVTLSAGAAFAWVKNVANGLDVLNDLKDATGASVENLSALEDVAIRTGTSFDTVGTSLTRFNGILKDAKPGTDADAALKALNLNIKELQSLDPAEALRQTAVALSGFADDGNKARLVQELFGKSVREVAPFLKDLAEQTRLVGKVTTEEAQAAEAFNKQIFSLQKNVQDLSRYLAGDLVTSLNAAGAAFRTGGLWEALKVLYGGTDQFKSDKRLVDQVDTLMNLEKALSDFRREGYAEDSRVIKNTLAQIAVVREQVKVTQGLREAATPYDRGAARLKRQGVLAPSVEFSGASKDKEKAEAGPRAQANELEVYIRSLERTLEKTQELSAVETARLRIGESLSRTSSIVMQKQAMGLAERIDAAKLADEENKAREKNNAAAAAELDAMAKENDAIVASNQSLADQIEEMGLATAALQQLKLARLDATIAAERETLVGRQNMDGQEAYTAQIERRINLLLRERELLAKQGERTVQVEVEAASAEAAKSLHSDVKSALSNAFRDSKNPALAFAEGLGNVVYTRMTNSLGNSLADLLVGSGKPGSTGGILSGLLGFMSFDGGGNTGSGPRTGGIDGKGGFMGILHPNETVIDHTKGGMRGGFAPSTSIVVQGGGNTGEIYANVSRALDARDRQWTERLQAAGVF